MNDDRLQGILFSKTVLVDLTPHSRYERLASKVKGNVGRVQHYVIRSKDVITHLPSPVKRLNSAASDREIRELADRLRFRD